MTADELLEVGPWLLDPQEGEVVVLTHLDAHQGGLWRRVRDLAGHPSQPVVLDDAPDFFQVRHRRVDLPLRFVSDAPADHDDYSLTLHAALPLRAVRDHAKGP